MKAIVSIARILVGGLFIFSGLIKAIDPLGLSYKMEEFFEAWGADNYLPSLMDLFHGHSYLFSVVMITLEVVLGVALLVGWRKKMTLWLLLLLMLFFTFLTSYVLFSGKIRACGCFGDCVPLTPIQTFTKDIILLVLVFILLFGQKYINPLLKGMAPFLLVTFSLIATVILQLHVVKHLPAKDCLPYKVGNNILELRKMPEGAIPDKYEYVFVYEKGIEKKEFNVTALPDSTWKFVERKQTLVQKGKNNVPLINDFSLKTDHETRIYEKNGEEAEFETNDLPDSSWTFKEKKFTSIDSTETILGQTGGYYLFFIKEMEASTGKWSTGFTNLYEKAKQQNRPIYIVTADKEKAQQYFNELNKFGLPVLTCDATAIKTAARANPTLFVMKGPVVQAKYSWADLDKTIK